MRITEKPPSFTNKLAQAESPYLRQHAHNPVYWYPWCEEALRRAREEDKPIFLSVGYSSCYWCHVMEREVFANLSIASQMNRMFINIKVDREEHPQIDDLYMHARQVMTHEGGWPNNVFLTPDLKPFYAGGTYGASELYGKPSFPRLIDWLYDAWQNDRENLLKIAEETTGMLAHFMVAKSVGDKVDFTQAIEAARAEIAQQYDAQSGGFYRAPKFPQENYLQFLLAHHRATGNSESLDMAVMSLGKMAAGGIFDQVGCGFHRYAVDRDWMVPHFEKMLYNQALLARCYTEAAALTDNPWLTDIARGTCEFVLAQMRDFGGAFYCAIDAEGDEVEGAYYAWSPKEIESLLTEDETAFFLHHYGLAEIPRVPGHKHPDGDVIISRMPLYQAALSQNVPYMQLAALSGVVMNKLLVARNERPAPILDHKIIVGWNGLMIDALAYAGKIFAKRHYIEHARRAAEYLLKHAADESGKLFRCVVNGRAGQSAVLEDYAYFVKGLLSVYEATQEPLMLTAAKHLMQTAHVKFGDGDGAFFTTEAENELPVRSKLGTDGVLPSANAVMAENYFRLAEITGEADMRNKAAALLQFFLAREGGHWAEYAAILSVAAKFMQPQSLALTPVSAHPGARLVEVEAVLFPPNPQPGDRADITVTLSIAKNYTIGLLDDEAFPEGATRFLFSTPGMEVETIVSPTPNAQGGKPGFSGVVHAVAQVRFDAALSARPDIDLVVEYVPCRGDTCFSRLRESVKITG